MPQPEGRVCTRCKNYKPFVFFSLERKGKFGHAAQCKACRNGWHQNHFLNLTPEQRALHNERSKMQMRQLRAKRNLL